MILYGRSNTTVGPHELGENLNKSHRSTLEIVKKDPVSKNLEWRRIEALIKSTGADVIEGRGSRVRFELNGVVVSFHRPHPHKEAKPYQVRDAREFLKKIGVLP